MNVYRYLATPEPNGKKIGLFRIVTAIFGGLLVSYLGICTLAKLSPLNSVDSAVIALLYYTIVWAGVTLWIALSPTKWSALKRFFIPTALFSLLLYLVY